MSSSAVEPTGFKTFYARMMPPQKINNIQRLRGMAVVLVIAYHLYRTEEKYFPTGRILPDWWMFGGSGVDLFFVISGFVMVWTTQHKEVSFLSFLKKRFLRIYPLYWFYTVLVLFVFFLKPAWVNASQGGQFSLLESFLLLPGERLPLLMVGWSLVFEVYFYIVFAALLFFPLRVRDVLLAAWAFALLVMALFFSAGSPYSRLFASPMALEFILGCFAARLVGNQPLAPLLRSAVIFGGLVFALFIPILFSAEIVHGLGIDRALLFGFLYCSLVLSGAETNEDGNARKRGLLLRMGDASYSLYLSHLLVLSAGARFLSALFPHAEPRPLFLLVLFALTLFCGELSYRLLERPLTRFLNR